MFDNILPICTPNEFKILMVIFRKTRGWNKDTDKISYSQFRKLTGISSNSTIKNNLDSLVKKGMILQVAGTGGSTSEYSLNQDYEPADYRKCNDLITESVTSTVTESVNTKETNKQTLKKTNAGGKTPAQSKIMQDMLKARAEVNSPEFQEKKERRKERIAGLWQPDKQVDLLANVREYPSDVIEIIEAFCERWKKIPPAEGASDYSKWIKNAREVKEKLQETGLPLDKVFDEAYYIWKTPPQNMDIKRSQFAGNFTVFDLGSINKLIRDATSNILMGTKKRKTKVYYDPDGKRIEVEVR